MSILGCNDPMVQDASHLVSRSRGQYECMLQPRCAEHCVRGSMSNQEYQFQPCRGWLRGSILQHASTLCIIQPTPSSMAYYTQAIWNITEPCIEKPPCGIAGFRARYHIAKTKKAKELKRGRSVPSMFCPNSILSQNFTDLVCNYCTDYILGSLCRYTSLKYLWFAFHRMEESLGKTMNIRGEDSRNLCCLCSATNEVFH